MSQWKTKFPLSCIGNAYSMVANGLETQGAKALAAMVLTKLFRVIPVSAHNRMGKLAEASELTELIRSTISSHGDSISAKSRDLSLGFRNY